MNRSFAILTIVVFSCISCTNAKNIASIPEDVFDQSKPYGINLTVAAQQLKKEREEGVGNSPFNTLFLLRTLKDKQSEMWLSFIQKNQIGKTDISSMIAMDATVKDQEKKVMDFFGLSKNQINALPGMKQNSNSNSFQVLEEINNVSPILATIAGKGFSFFDNNLLTKPEGNGRDRIRSRSPQKKPHLIYRNLKIPTIQSEVSAR